MSDPAAELAPFRVDVVDGMTIEWDVPIVTSDGIVLRGDVFRPTAHGSYPAILTYGPYGKGMPFQEDYSGAWEQMINDHPDVVEGSSGKYQVFETVDPEKWVPEGYVCIRVDSRGAGRSPGLLDIFSQRETRDLYECIEWAAEQPWSSGRVGLCGISYFGMNQWRGAALRPPHLAACCIWEAAGDIYRDSAYHGGIRTQFIDNFYYRAIAEISQYGLGARRGNNPLTGQPIYGDETYSDEELAQRRVDFAALVKGHPFLDDYYRGLEPDWSQISVPVLSAGNWGGQGLHLRGSTLGFEKAATADKWLEMHNDTHWASFYAKDSLELQKRFLGHYLKGEDTGWPGEPRVQVVRRHVDGHTDQRVSTQWPLAETQWTRYYLDASDTSMRPEAPQAPEAVTQYRAGEGRASFSYLCPHDLELAGPAAAKLYVESSTVDADLFLVLRAFAPDGTEVVFQGTIDPHTPIGQGWLRASHRALEPDQTRPFLPVHRHDHAEPLTPGTTYEVDIEILPTSLVLPAGYVLTLDVQGHDYVYPGATYDSGDEISMGAVLTGCGPWIHQDPSDRPPDVYGGTVKIHTGGAHRSYLLLPVIPT